MAVTVQEAADADIRRACEIELSAYASNTASPVLFPGPFPPDSLSKRVDFLISTRREDPTARYLKALDEETGEQIAFSKWHIYDTPKAVISAERPLQFGPGTNQEACMAFFGGILKKRKELMGNQPHVYLHMLHTDPKYQRQGAASALMKWGLETADKMSLPVYLESSPDAHGFYQKYGFRDIGTFPLDLSQYGGSHLHTTPLMIRSPSGDNE